MTTERIHIILKSGLPMGDVVFRGVYGTKNDSGKFIPSADFNKISHLFDALGDGAPISDDDVVCIEVPQCELPLVKAQLMSKLSARWTKNYGQLIPAD